VHLGGRERPQEETHSNPLRKDDHVAENWSDRMKGTPLAGRGKGEGAGVSQDLENFHRSNHIGEGTPKSNLIRVLAPVVPPI